MIILQSEIYVEVSFMVDQEINFYKKEHDYTIYTHFIYYFQWEMFHNFMDIYILGKCDLSKYISNRRGKLNIIWTRYNTFINVT